MIHGIMGGHGNGMMVRLLIEIERLKTEGYKIVIINNISEFKNTIDCSEKTAFIFSDCNPYIKR